MITRNPNFHSGRQHAQRPPGRDRRRDRRHARAVGERDRRRQLDWYFESVPPDRLTELKARYPEQVHLFVAQQHHLLRHERAQVPVQQAGGAPGGQLRDRPAGAGEDLRRPGHPHREHPAARLRRGLQAASPLPARRRQGQAADPAGRGRGREREVWGHTTDPTPKAVQYMAGRAQLDRPQGHGQDRGRVGVLGTIATQKGDPQIAFNDWNQDYPEAQDWIDVLLNGEHIVNVGNNDSSNTNIPAYNKMIDQAKAMPLGAGPRRHLGQARLPVHEERRRLGAVHEPGVAEVRVAASCRARVQRHLLRAVPVDVALLKERPDMTARRRGEAGGDVSLAWRRLRRNPAADGVGDRAGADRASRASRARRCGRIVACHHGPNDQNIQGFVHEGGKRRSRWWRTTARRSARAAGLLPARGRRERSRPVRAPALRRPHLADRGRPLGASVRRASRCCWAARRLHRRRRGCGDLALGST